MKIVKAAVEVRFTWRDRGGARVDSVQLHRLLANGKVLCFKRLPRAGSRCKTAPRHILWPRQKKKERKKKKREEKYHRENGVAPRYRGLNTKRGTGGIAGVSYSLANLGPHCSVLIEGEYHGR